MNPKISILITAHNYAKFLPQCIDSALQQNFSGHEVIVVDDGSADCTPTVLDSYKGRIKTVRLEGVGLASACNHGIRLSKGDYIIRLDADDYFDENMLIVLSNVLDRNPNIHLVYSDFYEVDLHGEIIRHRRLQKINTEVKLLDRSPLAAGAMFRRSCYDDIGGYNEDLNYQEDYDFWIRFTEKYNVYNVNLPLMYYRKHERSMSTNEEPRLASRRYVKEVFLEKRKIDIPKVLAVIPTRSKPFGKVDQSRCYLGGTPLISHSIRSALKSRLLDRVVVSTENSETADHARKAGAEVPFLRPSSLSMQGVHIEAVVKHLLTELYTSQRYEADLVVVLQVNNPFRKGEHIDEAIRTQIIHNTDSVISVHEDLSFHWRPGTNGLTPVIYKERMLKREKDTVYRENGMIHLYKAKNVLMGIGLGKRIGHIEMTEKESFRIRSEFDLWIAEQMLTQGKI